MKKVELLGNKILYFNNIMMKLVCCGFIFSLLYCVVLYGYYKKIYYNWENILLFWYFEMDIGVEDLN